MNALQKLAPSKSFIKRQRKIVETNRKAFLALIYAPKGSVKWNTTKILK